MPKLFKLLEKQVIKNNLICLSKIGSRGGVTQVRV